MKCCRVELKLLLHSGNNSSVTASFNVLETILSSTYFVLAIVGAGAGTYKGLLTCLTRVY